MARHTACLSFDFDAVSGVIEQGLHTPTLISRGEFSIVGTGWMLNLLENHDIK